jgi:hypothetical protein
MQTQTTRRSKAGRFERRASELPFGKEHKITHEVEETKTQTK